MTRNNSSLINDPCETDEVAEIEEKYGKKPICIPPSEGFKRINISGTQQAAKKKESKK